MDTELIDNIRFFLKNMETIAELDKDKSHKLITKASRKFVSDPMKRWWWESLSCDSKTVEYSDDDGLEIIKMNLKGDNSVFLVVTDDEFTPWPVFQGNLDEILELISEQRYFEYFLIGETEDWLIFDNHHNVLVVVGSISKQFHHNHNITTKASVGCAPRTNR